MMMGAIRSALVVLVVLVGWEAGSANGFVHTLRIEQPSNFLVLCEVQLFAKDGTEVQVAMSNARGGPQGAFGLNEYAIDNDLSQDYIAARECVLNPGTCNPMRYHCTHSAGTLNNFWEADFEWPLDKFQPGEIRMRIYNRVDCSQSCKDRIVGIKVFVLDARGKTQLPYANGGVGGANGIGDPIIDLVVLRGPTESPTESPTKSPTVPPTSFPTRRPTTLRPSSSPTAARNLCTFADVQTWNSEAVRDKVDSTYDDCGAACVLELGASDAVYKCMGECMADAQDIAPLCGQCFGSYAQCMISTCVCPFGRRVGTCTGCSLNECEPEFERCTSFPMPKFEPATELEEGVVVVLIASAGGGALFLVGALILFTVFRNRRSSSSVRALLAAAGKRDSRPESRTPNPSSSTFDVTNPVAPVALAVTANPSYEAKASSSARAASAHPNKFRVAFAFTANFEDELSCEEGDILVAIKPEGDSWFLVKNPISGKEGIVPRDNLVAA